MSRKLKFFITDVFGESRYSGNQLATFLDASLISTDEMQKIAGEINFSETTFIFPDLLENQAYRVRIFTPGSEVDFAGHPTLGTAHVIRKHLIKKQVDQVILNLNVGHVPVTWVSLENDEEIPFMRQIEPEFGVKIDTAMMADVLKLKPADFDSLWPIQAVSTGLPHFIVPLKTMDALKRVTIHLENYWRLVDQFNVKVILVFCPGGYTERQVLGVRVFPIAYGISEDPATGSGNGCLAAYLSEHRYFGSESIDIQVGQGYEIGRPSQLTLKAVKEKGSIRIDIGGRVLSVAEGLWE